MTSAICPRQSNRLVLRALSKRRFYRAVMKRFLDTKMLQFATFRESLHTYNLFENIRRMWSENLNRTLEESLEALELFDFTSNFMLLHILEEPGTLSGWMVDSDIVARSHFELDGEDSLLYNWMSLLPRLQPYLTPFDILFAWRKDKLNHEILNFFASLLAASEHEPPGVEEIESNVSCVLEHVYPAVNHGWGAYRYHGWRYGARGRIFNEHVIVDKIADDIIQFKHDGRYWWELMTQEENGQSRPIGGRITDLYLTKLPTVQEDSKDDDIWFTITKEDLQAIRFKEQSIEKELVAKSSTHP